MSMHVVRKSKYKENLRKYLDKKTVSGYQKQMETMPRFTDKTTGDELTRFPACGGDPSWLWTIVDDLAVWLIEEQCDELERRGVIERLPRMEGT